MNAARLNTALTWAIAALAAFAICICPVCQSDCRHTAGAAGISRIRDSDHHRSPHSRREPVLRCRISRCTPTSTASAITCSMYPLACAFGSTLWIHRAVSLTLTLLCCGLILVATYKLTGSGKLAFAAAVLLYCDLAIRCADLGQPALPVTILARPDAMALALFLGSVFWPMWKRFTVPSLIGSAVLSTIRCARRHTCAWDRHWSRHMSSSSSTSVKVYFLASPRWC